ncbi:hypothetical protein PRZ48_005432 [Zasmidium cellare]|uniref:non-specific serine/threonine protein kinase n=1 Tax=Zasmidium cellare TaxID=395010 RepID=A0ABR0ETU7_ZASCE|nr:hypothetical protein PRZ48_005432 [Zasmidium cellare]
MPPKKTTTTPAQPHGMTTRGRAGGAPVPAPANPVPAPALAPAPVPAPAPAPAAPKPTRGKGKKRAANDADDEDDQDGPAQTKKARPKKRGKTKKNVSPADGVDKDVDPDPDAEDENVVSKKAPPRPRGKGKAPVAAVDLLDDEDEDDADEGPALPVASKKDGKRKVTEGVKKGKGKEKEVAISEGAGAPDRRERSATPGANLLGPDPEEDGARPEEDILDPPMFPGRDAAREHDDLDRGGDTSRNDLPMVRPGAGTDSRARRPDHQPRARPSGESSLPDYSDTVAAERAAAAKGASQGANPKHNRPVSKSVHGNGDHELEAPRKIRKVGEDRQPARAGADKSRPSHQPDEAGGDLLGDLADVANDPPAQNEISPLEPEDEGSGEELHDLEALEAAALTYSLLPHTEAKYQISKDNMPIMLTTVYAATYPILSMNIRNIWNSDATCNSCRSYIARALDVASFSGAYDLAKGLQACSDLVEDHGGTEEALWSQAPRLERYICGLFDTRESWPLDLQALEDQWRALREDLEAATDPPSDRALQAFDQHRQFARRECKLERIFLVPPAFGDDRSAADFIREMWNESLLLDALALLRPIWAVYISRTHATRRQAMQREFDSMKENPTPNVLCGPKVSAWKRQWRHSQDGFFATQPPEELRQRFLAYAQIAHDHLDRYGELLQPRVWPPRRSIRPPAVEYVHMLSRQVRQQRLQALFDSWDTAIANAPTEQDRQVLTATRALVEQAATHGDPTWRPDETQESQAREVARQKETLRNDFSSERSGIGGHWNRRAVLGEGSYGQAVLWVKYDSRHRIRGRIVLKDVPLPNARLPTTHSFDRQKYWFGPVHDRRPMEAIVPQRLRKATQSFHILGCLGWTVFDRYQTYRIYTEFCPHGDLDYLLKQHARAGQHPSYDENGVVIDHLIPERALWSIFEGLTSAVLIMQTGRLPRHDMPDEPHIHPVIHCDIKPLNDEAHEEFWPGIPVVKLGDFGLVVQTTAANARVRGAAGTKGFNAPEQAGRSQTAELASDVWGIGRTMLSLVNLDRDPLNLLDTAGDLFFPPEANAAAQHKYSGRLLELIASCLQREPEDRRSISRLWADVQNHVGQRYGLRDHPLRTKKPDPDEMQLGYKQDIYKLWVAPK